jgi:hypothetical protein
MSIRFNNGSGQVFPKETPETPLARITYKLTETDATKYTKKRWWGDFSCGEEIKRLGNFFIEFEDGRRGECAVIANTEDATDKAQIWYYHFNGRGALSRRR